MNSPPVGEVTTPTITSFPSLWRTAPTGSTSTVGVPSDSAKRPSPPYVRSRSPGVPAAGPASASDAPRAATVLKIRPETERGDIRPG
jgi:hypothetical protein